MEAVATEPLLSMPGLVEWLDVSEATIYRLRDRKEDPLPLLKIGGQLRADPEQVREWIKRQAATSGKAWRPKW